MDVKINSLENAILAAKTLGMEEIPWAWIKFIQCGWEIRPAHCVGEGDWVWMKPNPAGTMDMSDYVGRHEVNITRLLDTKRDSFTSITQKRLKKLKPGEKDVGKIFYTYPLSEEGIIVSREDFLQLDPADIGWWIEIGEFDIP